MDTYFASGDEAVLARPLLVAVSVALGAPVVVLAALPLTSPPAAALLVVLAALALEDGDGGLMLADVRGAGALAAGGACSHLSLLWRLSVLG